jgi:bifunctional DNA-binding transcriptional regulator/antitoxin component of YhaV-PrlF toxin-antitoxin module
MGIGWGNYRLQTDLFASEPPLVQLVHRCSNPCEVILIPKWLQVSSGILEGDILELKRVTEKGILVIKYKPPEFLVVKDEVWLPRKFVTVKQVKVEDVKKKMIRRK